ncbi:MAG: 3-oxoacyl-ACP synthase [Rickettsiales bacterium]|jgi:3-oxoacyl-[acyl-carrier-protein] synthase III|nr:3-oxoacyl-ACP synthase [Rickettsiales bacterium]|tara:strand:+ start:9549 stop:10520 length:972 start_codon:yes stop_codon:yes gene_type:complete
MNIVNSKIIATGSYLPEKIITNYDLSKTIDTSHEWIYSRTGIIERRIADDKEYTSDLAYEAAIDAINKSKININDIDAIILATTTPDLTFPATSVILQEKLGIKNAFAFDIQAVCSGFLYALTCANSFIKSNQCKNILVIGSETLSRILDWNDRNSCILFGDGAGALILSSCQDKSDKSDIILSNIKSDGSYCDILKTTGGTSRTRDSGYITMNGKEVFRNAVDKMTKSALDIVKQSNISLSEIDMMIPHQANIRIIDAIADKLHLPQNKVIKTLSKHGNTSAASIPLALDYAINNKLIKRGDNILFEALGAGLTWGSMIAKY